jgi:adenylate cyclase class IV
MRRPRRFEYVVPAEYWPAKEKLALRTRFLKRSTVEDAYLEHASGGLARLRKENGVSRLSFHAVETVVLDRGAGIELLRTLGFEDRARVRLVRDSWAFQHYRIHLDQVEGVGAFIVVEGDAGKKSERTLKREARRLIRRLKLPRSGRSLDSIPSPPYSVAINRVP